MYRLLRSGRLVAFVVLVVVIFTVMSFTARERERVSFLERAFMEILRPIQAATSRTGAWVYDVVGGIVQLGGLRTENKRLRDELAGLEAIRIELERLKAENQRLRQVLELTRQEPRVLLVARVISRNADNWYSTAIIDKGSAHGVIKDMPVLTPQGLVGRVLSVSPHSAIVLLITDPDSGVGGMVVGSGDPGVVLGQVGTSALKMKFFSRDAGVGIGDIVVSSGLGEVFPEGLPIGRVTDVKKGELGLLKYAELKPLADIDRMREVLLLAPAARRDR